MEEKILNHHKKFVLIEYNKDLLDSRDNSFFKMKGSSIHGNGLFLEKEIKLSIAYKTILIYGMNDKHFTLVLKKLGFNSLDLN